jgi:hypothetical protein
MATVPAAPTAPQRDVVKAWQMAYSSISQDLDRWATRIGDGQLPLTAGQQQRLASTIKAAETFVGMTPAQAQIAAGVWEPALRAEKMSIAASATAIPQHVYAAAAEAGAASGWNRVVNQRAYTAVINNQIGELTSDFQNLTAVQQNKLANDLATALATGGDPRTLSRNVKGTVTEWFRSGQSRSLMISRTNLARAYDAASASVYQEAFAEDLIKGWRWVAHGANPCLVCQDLHGAIFDCEEGTYRHPNCCCTTVPVLKDEAGEVGERIDPFPGTNADELELWQSDKGWVNWRLPPKNPTGRAKGKVIQKGIKGNPGVPASPPRVAPRIPPAPGTLRHAARKKVAAKKKPAAKPEVAKAQGFREITDPNDPQFLREIISNNKTVVNEFGQEVSSSVDTYLAGNTLRRYHVTYDPDARVSVRWQRDKKYNMTNMISYQKMARETVEANRKNLPVDKDRVFSIEFNGQAKGSTEASTILGSRFINVNANQLGLMTKRGVTNRAKNKEFRAEKGKDWRWSISDDIGGDATARNTLTHEIAHDIDNKANAPRRAALFTKWREYGLDDLGKESLRTMNYRGKVWTRESLESLSNIDGPTIYARTNDKEMFAEAYTAWMNRDAVKWPKATVEWFTDFAKEFGWT